jgi:hypothetical protein
MMNTSNLNKKIKSYSALAGSIALMSSQADAQIVYTDINPDSTTTIPGTAFNLDLDNGGVIDFTFNLVFGTATTTSQGVGITAAGTNAVAGSIVGSYTYPLALNNGDTIKSTFQFNTGTSQSMASYFGSSYSYGNWIGVSDKFIGLQFYIGSQLHYGWARLDVSATANQFTIKDYAYNATPNDYIIAGEMGVGIDENTLMAATSIYSVEKNIIVSFLKEQPINAVVKIGNALGQEIYNGLLKDKETSIDLSKEKTGIYFVTITNKNIVYTKKVYLR